MWAAAACAAAAAYAAHAQHMASNGVHVKPVERYIGPDREAMDAALHISSLYGTSLMLAFVISGGYLIAQVLGLV